MRPSRTDALALLRESLATLPSELDARAEFFIQWRTRTMQTLERIFTEDATAITAFQEIDFSPRRLTKNEIRDAQLKLDSFLSGCVAARAQLEELVRRLLAEPESEAPVKKPSQSVISESAADLVIKGAHMNNHELCAPVRSSLSRVLGAWERGDREAALVLSAQLLADLTVLSRDNEFKSAFDGVVSKFVGRDGIAGAMNSIQTAAPLCVWSMVAAMNEVMRPG